MEFRRADRPEATSDDDEVTDGHHPDFHGAAPAAGAGRTGINHGVPLPHRQPW